MHFRQKKVILFLCIICFVFFVLFVNMLKSDIEPREKEKTGEGNSPPYEVEFVPETNTPDDTGTEEIKYDQNNEGVEFFLGIYGDRIAVYSRQSTGEVVLEEVLPYSVKSVYYDELTKGIPFLNQEEKLLLLENLTS